MVDIKPKTIIKSQLMDTIERESIEIEKINTIDEINNYCDKLINDVLKMKIRKKAGYDVSSDMDDLNYKITLLNDAKQKIKEREITFGTFYFNSLFIINFNFK